MRISAEPISAFYCHCADCRAANGAAYVGVALYPSSAVEVVAGTVATYAIRNLPRSFCPSCGARMFARVPDDDITGIVAERLPEGAFHADFHVHCREAIAPVRDALPHYEALPPAFGGDERTVDW
ncbi:MAG: GFA family protein [Tabrizicola flagellatus]|uniref:GFA family protein n=1 Tax=Tabrizicola flagellatus TaxID=2593021 RepID=UPI00391AB4FA